MLTKRKMATAFVSLSYHLLQRSPLITTRPTITGPLKNMKNPSGSPNVIMFSPVFRIYNYVNFVK